MGMMQEKQSVFISLCFGGTTNGDTLKVPIPQMLQMLQREVDGA